MKTKLLLCLSAVVICAVILLYNIADSPKYQQNIFPSASSTLQATDESGKININKATEEELTALYGIGEIRAKKITEYRKENGRILSLDELLNIDGISQSVIDKNADKIIF